MTTDTSTIALEKDGKKFEAVCLGDGPVDAAFSAIDQIVKPVEHTFELYRINSVSEGKGTLGELIIGADSHTCTYGALGAFSIGVGSTDMVAGMAAGENWFRVPSAIKVVLKSKLNKWVGGKDVILHLIGKIGVDGARTVSRRSHGLHVRG